MTSGFWPPGGGVGGGGGSVGGTLSGSPPIASVTSRTYFRLSNLVKDRVASSLVSTEASGSLVTIALMTSLPGVVARKRNFLALFGSGMTTGVPALISLFDWNSLGNR